MIFSGNVWAAQSTADVPVTDKVKESARQKILAGKSSKYPAEDQYIIGHGDVLDVHIYGEGDMSAALAGDIKTERDDGLRTGPGGVRVRIDGRISLKHIGDIEVIGFTLTQLADYLKIIYASVYDDPIVTVVLVQSNSRRYTVMGKVARPGTYYIDYPINIVQAIAACGGFTEWAKSEITLIRKEPGLDAELFENNKLIFDYDDFLVGKELEKNVRIRAGDIIVVH